MTCEQCLTHLPPGGAFCPNCGHPAPAGDGRPADAQAWGLLQVAVGLAVVLFAAIIVSGGVDLLFGEGNLAWGAIAGSALLGLAMAGMPAVAAIGGSRQVPLALGLTVPQLPFLKTAAFTAAALGLSMGATGLYSWAVRALDVGILVPPEIPGVLVLPGAGAVLTFAALAGWTPLTEEIFFRGFVFAGLANRLGTVRGVVLSAAVFSLFHVAPSVLLPIFVTGILLALLYQRTRSIWPCIAAHAGQNAAALSYAAWGQ